MTKSELVRRWFDTVWNRGVESGIHEMLAPNVVLHDLGDADLLGPDQFHEFYRGFRAAFPSVQVTLDQVLESGDYVVCRAHVDVTTADGRGPFGFDGTCTARVENGRFVEGWNHFDFLGLLTRMGVVPADAMAKALAPPTPVPGA